MSESKYLIYHNYENLSLIDSSLALLKKLEIPVVGDKTFEYYGGHWGWLVNERIFFLSQAYNIALASNSNAELLVLEEDAYFNLLFAKKHIEENPTLFSLVQSELAKFNLEYNINTKVVYLADLLLKNISKIKTNQKIKFNDFSVSIFHSSRNIANLQSDLWKDSVIEILKELDLKVDFKENYAVFQNELFNPKLAYKYSAKSFENALDSGSSFILSNSMGVFNMFDKKRSKLSKIINRNFGNIPILFLPQVILLSFGIKNDMELAFRYHKFIPDFI